MATATHTKNGTPQAEAAFRQMKELNEQVLTATRKAGTLYVDAYEKAVERAIDLEHRVAELAPQEWLETLIRTHADIARDVTESYTSTARTLLKQ